MTRPSTEELLGRLARRGLTDPETAKRALHATLAVLGERLVDDEAMTLAAAVPAELARLVENVEYDSDFEAAELYHRIARREQTTGARAKEHAEIVVAALGEGMDEAQRTRLARALPGNTGELLLGRADDAEPPPYGSPRREPQVANLATGRPGSAHPLSEAARAPGSGQTHSVARNPAPHEDTKLSTSTGLTQERLHETLADSRRQGR